MDEWFQEKFIEPKDLEKVVASLREKKKTIVTLNGSFDLMHAGHLFIVHEASKKGDSLIVALNSDPSIKQYKGEERPIISLADRLRMVAALEWVDFVTFFEEADPRAVLSTIKPDVHVNGAEYGEGCNEAETVKQFGGSVQLVRRIPGLATSAIIEKIKKL